MERHTNLASAIQKLFSNVRAMDDMLLEMNLKFATQQSDIRQAMEAVQNEFTQIDVFGGQQIDTTVLDDAPSSRNLVRTQTRTQTFDSRRMLSVDQNWIANRRGSHHTTGGDESKRGERTLTEV